MKEASMEQWKDIKGYEGLYQVSNYGRVKSLERFRKARSGCVGKVSERILRPLKNGLGYYQVGLYKDGILKMHFIHRLAALAFIDNPENSKKINHKDEVKANNNVNNLEWHNCKYNRTEKVSKPIIQCDMNGNIIKKWASLTEAAQTLNIYQSSISNCCAGRYKTSGGFKWSYAYGKGEN